MRTPGLLLASALLSFPVPAQTPDYFPLQPGNQWVYRASGATDPLVVSVLRTEVVNGREYGVVTGLAGPEIWLRGTEAGSLVALDRVSGAESPWVNFAAAAGERFATAVSSCNEFAKVLERTYEGRYPAGTYPNVFLVQYEPGPCADAGVSLDAWLPWVGLLQRTITTIAGPRTYDLVYARIAGYIQIGAPEVSFALATDRPVYEAVVAPLPRGGICCNPGSLAQAFVRLTFRDSSADPVRVSLPFGAEFDLVLRNEKGVVVWRWTDGKVFPAAFREVNLRGEVNWAAAVTLADAKGNSLPAGRYTFEGYLNSIDGPLYRATVTIDLKVSAPK